MASPHRDFHDISTTSSRHFLLIRRHCAKPQHQGTIAAIAAGISMARVHMCWYSNDLLCKGFRTVHCTWPAHADGHVCACICMQVEIVRTASPQPCLQVGRRPGRTLCKAEEKMRTDMCIDMPAGICTGVSCALLQSPQRGGHFECWPCIYMRKRHAVGDADMETLHGLSCKMVDGRDEGV